MRTRELEKLVVEAEIKVARTKEVLGTLISWMAGSANSPIRRDEALELLKMLDGVKK